MAEDNLPHKVVATNARFPTEIMEMIVGWMRDDAVGIFASASYSSKEMVERVIQKRLENKWRDNAVFGKDLFGKEHITRFGTKEKIYEFLQNHYNFSRRFALSFGWNYFPSASVLIEFPQPYYNSKELCSYQSALQTILPRFKHNIKTLVMNLGNDNVNCVQILIGGIVLASHLEDLKRLYIYKNDFNIGVHDIPELNKIGRKCKRNSGLELEELQLGRWEDVEENGTELNLVTIPPIFFIARCQNLTQHLKRLSFRWPEIAFGQRYNAWKYVPPYYLNELQRFPNLEYVSIRQPDSICYRMFIFSPLQRITFSFSKSTLGVVGRIRDLLNAINWNASTLKSLWLDVNPEAIARLSKEDKESFVVDGTRTGLLNGKLFPLMRTLTVRATTAVTWPRFIEKVSGKFPNLERLRLVPDCFEREVGTETQQVAVDNAKAVCWDEMGSFVTWITVLNQNQSVEHFSRPGAPHSFAVPTID